MSEPLGPTLRRAAGDPAHPFDMGPVVERTSRVRRRRRTARAAAGALALLVAVGLGVVLTAGIGRVAPAVLDVPPVGDVSGALLDDGTPVWVVHRPDGEVLVLRAAESTGTPGSPWAYSWCPAGGRFESFWGASWSAEGLLLGGPASNGLARYETRRSGDRVEILDPDPEPQGRGAPDPTPVGRPWCDRGPGSVIHPAWEPDDDVSSGRG